MDADQLKPKLDKNAPRRSMERLVRCSTPLCGAVAVWGGENPHIWSGYERKCDTCYHRNGYRFKSHMKRLPDTSNVQAMASADTQTPPKETTL